MKKIITAIIIAGAAFGAYAGTSVNINLGGFGIRIGEGRTTISINDPGFHHPFTPPPPPKPEPPHRHDDHRGKPHHHR